MALLFCDDFDFSSKGATSIQELKPFQGLLLLDHAVHHLLDTLKPDLDALVLLRRRMRVIEIQLRTVRLKETRAKRLIEDQFPISGLGYA